MFTRGLTLATVFFNYLNVYKSDLLMRGRGGAEGSTEGRIFLVTLMLTRGLTLATVEI